MRTEKEIRERLEDIDTILDLQAKLGIPPGKVVQAFRVVLSWVLQTSDESGDKNE